MIWIFPNVFCLFGQEVWNNLHYEDSDYKSQTLYLVVESDGSFRRFSSRVESQHHRLLHSTVGDNNRGTNFFIHHTGWHINVLLFSLAVVHDGWYCRLTWNWYNIQIFKKVLGKFYAFLTYFKIIWSMLAKNFQFLPNFTRFNQVSNKKMHYYIIVHTTM